jgi:hypothetical protein
MRAPSLARPALSGWLEIVLVNCVSIGIVLDIELLCTGGAISSLDTRYNPTMILHRSRLICIPLVTELSMVGIELSAGSALLANAEAKNVAALKICGEFVLVFHC